MWIWYRKEVAFLDLHSLVTPLSWKRQDTFLQPCRNLIWFDQHSVNGRTSEKVIDILADKDSFDFVDGPKGIKKLIQRKVESKCIFWNVVWNIRKMIDLLKSQMGLNPGTHFEDWLIAALREGNIETYADLVQKRNKIPALQHRDKEGIDFKAPDLTVIASEITTHTKVEFPFMADRYWKDVDAVSPAEFSRASISIPFFFHPYTINNIPNKGAIADPK